MFSTLDRAFVCSRIFGQLQCQNMIRTIRTIRTMLSTISRCILVWITKFLPYLLQVAAGWKRWDFFADPFQTLRYNECVFVGNYPIAFAFVCARTECFAIVWNILCRCGMIVHECKHYSFTFASHLCRCYSCSWAPNYVARIIFPNYLRICVCFHVKNTHVSVSSAELVNPTPKHNIHLHIIITAIHTFVLAYSSNQFIVSDARIKCMRPAIWIV